MKSIVKRVLRFICKWALMGCLALLILWVFGAIYVDGPFSNSNANLTLGLLWLIALGYLMFRFKKIRYRLGILFVGLAIVLVPWTMIAPSNDREWQQDWRKTGWAEIDGDEITFHNYRNFDYSKDGEITEVWETKTVRLSNLRGIDYFHDAFGGEWIAHPMTSFDFGVDGRVVMSIETRREEGEDYSEIGGLYKMFELQYVFGSEEDLVRVRTNIREEPVYLYSLDIGEKAMRGIFMQSVKALNDLKENPRWYHVVTANCTTSIRTQTPEKSRRQFDIRLLLNGKLDELLYERGDLIHNGLSFRELREASFINEKAQAAHDAPDFSTRIRVEN